MKQLEKDMRSIGIASYVRNALTQATRANARKQKGTLYYPQGVKERNTPFPYLASSLAGEFGSLQRI